MYQICSFAVFVYRTLLAWANRKLYRNYLSVAILIFVLPIQWWIFLGEG